MRKKNLRELEADLLRLKERESKIKEEMTLQKKAANVKAAKERNRQMYQLAEIVVQHYGVDVLESRDDFESFLLNYLYEWNKIKNLSSAKE